MKKRIELILCALIFCFGCFSISKGTYADEAFMKSLASGLEARWKLAEEQEAKLEENREVEPGSEEQIEEYAAYVEAELNAVSKYQDEKFADDRLQEQACSYIDCLNNQKEALQYASVDLQKYYAM